MTRKPPKQHFASDFDLDVLSNDLDMFRWFLLCYLFGKPIRSETAIVTWQAFIDKNLDTPWAIMETSERNLVKFLKSNGYARYQHATAQGLRICMKRLISLYDGSLLLMIESSADDTECSKRLQEFHGVGPKVAEIFMREVEEIFARRTE